MTVKRRLQVFSGVARRFCSNTRRLPRRFSPAPETRQTTGSTRDDWVAPFEDLGRVITPSHTTWTRAALIMARLVERGHLSPGGFSRSFLNDCLIAASARDHGFILVTRNTSDFALISQGERGIRYQPPWPEP
jgi:predicted nucleic acid-binding protein